MGASVTRPSSGNEVLQYKLPFSNEETEERRMSDLSDWASSVTSAADIQVASFLYHQEKMNVLVEPDVHDTVARIPGFGFFQTFYSQDTSDLHEKVDFVACLGGDGVILHASSLFRGAVPPIMSFNLGSLGFLTSHNRQRQWSVRITHEYREEAFIVHPLYTHHQVCFT